MGRTPVMEKMPSSRANNFLIENLWPIVAEVPVRPAADSCYNIQIALAEPILPGQVFLDYARSLLPHTVSYDVVHALIKIFRN